VIAPAETLRLLDGPLPADGAESLQSHLARLGPRPSHSGGAFIDIVDRAGLRGRGGAGFPTATKWAATRDRSRGNAIVVANGAETEPMSAKDRVLMTARPHLVLDGLLLAAEAVAAKRAVVYISRAHDDAAAAVTAAIDERRVAGDLPVPVTLARAPHRYVAGEESAAIAHLNGGAARPTTVPYQVSKGGIAMLTRGLAVELAPHIVAPRAECVERGQRSVDLLAVGGRGAERHHEADDAGEDGDYPAHKQELLRHLRPRLSRRGAARRRPQSSRRS